MTERFRMPMTWEMDRAGAFVGGSVYHSCLGTRGFPGETIALDVILTILCVCARMHVSAMSVSSLKCPSVSAQNLPCVSEAMRPYGMLCRLHCVVDCATRARSQGVSVASSLILANFWVSRED